MYLNVRLIYFLLISYIYLISISSVYWVGLPIMGSMVGAITIQLLSHYKFY